MMRIKRRVLTKTLVCALVLAAVGAGSWLCLYWDMKPSEPMCLALTRQDVKPLVGEVESVSASNSENGSPEPNGDFWICSVSGGSMRLLVEASPDADEGLSRYKDLGTSLLETVTAHRGGVSEPVPGIDATVVSWLQGNSAWAGWFEGDSAVIFSLSTTAIPDDDQARSALIGYFDELTRLLKRRAHQLLEAAGFAPPLTMRTPSPAATATDEPDPQQPPSPTATATATGTGTDGPSQTPAAGASTPPPRAPTGRTRSPSTTPTTDGRATDGPG